MRREFPYFYAPEEAGRPNYAFLSPTGVGDRGTFYSWLESGYGWLESAVRVPSRLGSS